MQALKVCMISGYPLGEYEIDIRLLGGRIVRSLYTMQAVMTTQPSMARIVFKEFYPRNHRNFFNHAYATQSMRIWCVQ